ncbi:DUF4411 family protein [Nakamurella aerolata]|uniref:DUF4411 family protein n=1 Tax=Nakamurella aerolata TaxID=1656892 RepID=A0A849A485_9ACTN|nr:DUF4411 family protein [Nakamurella aerolata]NNG35409.1 DUF4411 family protein [Nakamurella aerolata]
MYLLDANVFMEASRLYYSFELAPGFWRWLADPSMLGRVASIPAVRDEITAGKGDLVSWARTLPSSFWLPDSAGVATALVELANWATAPERAYRQEAIDLFLGSADYQLIAHAMASGATVVTREQRAPGAKRVIKIPDACDSHGLASTDPFTTFRALGLRLT